MADTPLTLLRIDASGRYEGSYSRRLADTFVVAMREAVPELTLRRHDLAQGVPFVDAAWIEANFTPDDQRSPSHLNALAHSDRLIDDLFAAEVIVLATPIYNFSVPASLKAWIDLVCRARKTFRYTERGPVGLLENKRAYVIITSGGVEVGSAMDFASDYLRHVFGFIGIERVEIIPADHLVNAPEPTMSRAQARLSTLAAAWEG